MDVSEKPVALIPYPEDGSSRFSCNTGKYVSDCMV
jgi:hypothetical protein